MTGERPTTGMSYNDIALVLARAPREPVFLQQLTSNPIEALTQYYPDFSPGPATIAFFQSLGTDFKDSAAPLKLAKDAIDGARDM